MHVLEEIRRRRSVRSYLKKDVENEKLREVLKAAMFSPTARNLRPWEFIVVTDGETKKLLSQATPYASFAKDAPLVLVICYDTTQARRFKEDCSLCAENIYLEATHQGLGTCFIQIAEGTVADRGDPEAFVKEVLGIPGHCRVQCLMPLGYPAQQPQPHTDGEYTEHRVHYEKF